MAIYKKCPFCEELFEIGPEDDEPMKRHIGLQHLENTPPVVNVPLKEARFALHVAPSLDTTQGLLGSILYERDVFVPVLARWYGLSKNSIREQFDRLESEMCDLNR